MAFDQISNDILLAYAEGELDATQRARVAALLNENPDLREKLDALLRLRQELRSVLHAVDQVPTPKTRIVSNTKRRLAPAPPEQVPAPGAPVVMLPCSFWDPGLVLIVVVLALMVVAAPFVILNNSLHAPPAASRPTSWPTGVAPSTAPPTPTDLPEIIWAPSPPAIPPTDPPVLFIPSPTAPAPPQVSFLAPVADSFVSRAPRAANFGRQPDLEVRADPESWVFIRFQAPPGPAVRRATLRLYVRTGAGPGGVLRTVQASWAEDSITWGRRPTQIGPIVGDLGRVTAGDYVTVDVTDMLQADGMLSLAILPASPAAADVAYGSRESDASPQLIVER